MRLPLTKLRQRLTFLGFEVPSFVLRCSIPVSRRLPSSEIRPVLSIRCATKDSLAFLILIQSKDRDKRKVVLESDLASFSARAKVWQFHH